MKNPASLVNFWEKLFPRVFGVQWKAYLFTWQLAFVCVCACGHGRHFNIRNWEGKGRHRRPATRGWSWSWRIWLLHVTRFEPESGIFRRRFSVFNNLQLQSRGDFQSTVTEWHSRGKLSFKLHLLHTNSFKMNSWKQFLWKRKNMCNWNTSLFV